MTSNSSSAAAGAKDFFESLVQLAQVMKSEPGRINADLNRRGEELLGIFQDTNYRNSLQDLRAQKIRAIEMTAKDISEGVMTLQSSSIGVSYVEGKFLPFVTPHGTPPRGNVVFSLNWRESKAFHSWRSQEEKEINQEDINVSLYRLAVILSEVI